jgi:hypothetical protein
MHRAEAEVGIATDVVAELEVWMDDVRALVVSLRHALAPLVASRIATVSEQIFSVSEVAHGRYSATGAAVELVLSGASQLVFLRPRGMSLLGFVETGMPRALHATGRVDVENGRERAVLLRFDHGSSARWYWCRGHKMTPFDEQRWIDLLAWVVGISLR